MRKGISNTVPAGPTNEFPYRVQNDGKQIRVLNYEKNNTMLN
jgi:hypothetical protein